MEESLALDHEMAQEKVDADFFNGGQPSPSPALSCEARITTHVPSADFPDDFDLEDLA